MWGTVLARGLWQQPLRTGGAVTLHQGILYFQSQVPVHKMRTIEYMNLQAGLWWRPGLILIVANTLLLLIFCLLWFPMFPCDT